MKKTLTKIVTAGTVTLAMAMFGTVTAQTLLDPVSGHTFTQPGAAFISSKSTRVLLYIAQARGLIHKNKYAQANERLKQALDLIEHMKAAQPTSKAQDHVRIAQEHLEYTSTREMAVDMLSLENVLTEISELVSVESAKEHLDSAKSHLENGDKEAANEDLRRLEAALTYTEIDLPLTATEHRITAAQSYLAQDKPHDAQLALLAAERGVRYLSVERSTGLVKAKEHLWKATKAYAEKHYADARTELEQATRGLAQTAEGAYDRAKSEMHALARDAQALTENLAQESSDLSKSIAVLWHRSVALAEREAELVSAGWGKLKTENNAKEELIDAKLQLAYAKAEQFVAQDSARAKIALEKAVQHLDAATAHMDEVTRKKVDDIKQDVTQLNDQIDSAPGNSNAVYEEVKADLQQLIRDL